MAHRALLLTSPPVLFGERWWANRIASKPHLASLAGFVRDVAEPRILGTLAAAERMDVMRFRAQFYLESAAN